MMKSVFVCVRGNMFATAENSSMVARTHDSTDIAPLSSPHPAIVAASDRQNLAVSAADTEKNGTH
jgi:hypothetical protein